MSAAWMDTVAHVTVATVQGFYTGSGSFTFTSTPTISLIPAFFVYAPSIPSGGWINPLPTPNGLTFRIGLHTGDLTAFYTATGGASTAVFTGTDFSASFSPNVTYTATVITQPALDGLYMQLYGYVQRASDSAWLNKAGAWVFNQVPCIAGQIVNNAGTIPNDGSWYGTVFGGMGTTTPISAGLTLGTVSLGNSLAAAGASPAKVGLPADEVDIIIAAITTVDAGTSGHLTAQINNGALSAGNYYISQANYDAWVLADLGSGVAATIQSVAFAPGVGLDSASSMPNTYPDGIEWTGCGLVVEASNSTSGPWALLGIFPANTFPERFVLNELRVNPSGPYRYARFRAPGSCIAVSAIKIYGARTGGVSWKPRAPTMTPGAGRLTDSGTVALTTLTAGATIYYAINATATTGSTAYTAPFTPTVAAPALTYVTAIAFHASGTTTTSDVTGTQGATGVTGGFNVSTAVGQFVPDTLATAFGTSNTWPQDFCDTRGILIEAHGGCMFTAGSSTTLFWLGLNFNSAMMSAGASAGPAPRGFRLYSSTDLGLNWTFQSLLLPPPPMTFQATNNQVNTNARGAFTVTERPHILFNPSPNNPANAFVLWCHLNCQTDYRSIYTGVATAPNVGTAANPIPGQFTWKTFYNGIKSQFPKDQSLFLDPVSGNAYLHFTNASTIYLAKLDPTVDWTNVTSDALITVNPNSGREAPVMIYRSGHYYATTSTGMPYGSGGADEKYRTATTIAGLSAGSDTSIYSDSPTSTFVANNAQAASYVDLPGMPGYGLWVADVMDPSESPVNLYHVRSVHYLIGPSQIPAAGGTLAIKSQAQNGWSYPATGTVEVPSTTYGSNLFSWYKGDANVYSDAGTTPSVNGGTVHQWNDQTANANHFTFTFAPSYTTPAYNGMGAVTFSGGQEMDTPVYGTALNQPYTIIFAAVLTRAALPGNNTFFDTSQANEAVVNTSSSSYGQYAGTLLTGGTTDPNIDIYEAFYSGANSFLKKNGVTIISGNVGTQTLPQLRIGANASGANFLTGDYTEILVIKRAITVAERTKTYNYLRSRWAP